MAARDVTAASGLAYPGSATGRVAVTAERLARIGMRGGLVGAMIVGSMAMWTVIPFGGLRLAAQVNGGSTRVSTAAALVAVVVIPTAMVLTARGLAALDRVHMHLVGGMRPRSVPVTRRSMSDMTSAPPSSMLDRILVVTVVIALVTLAVWFFLFAGSSLPR